jgi:hypothetical protein
MPILQSWYPYPGGVGHNKGIRHAVKKKYCTFKYYIVRFTEILFVAASAFWIPADALAAELSETHDPITGCVIELRGPITNGDADSLKRILANRLGYQDPDDLGIEPVSKFLAYTGGGIPFINRPTSFASENRKRICLNSPGGSYTEALEVANIVHQAGYGTVVERDSVCESACALIFLAGAFTTEGEAKVSDRHIHATAKLGFHAPALDLPGGTYSRAEVMDAYEVAIESMANIQNSSSILNFKNSLLAQMLSTPPSEMFYIDTVGKAIRWHIGVYGTKIPIELGALQMQLACDAALASMEDNVSKYGFKGAVDAINTEFDPNGHVSFSQSGSEPKMVFEGERSGYLQEAVSSCFFSYSTSIDEDTLIPGYMPGAVTFSDLDIRIHAAPYFLFAPDTVLASISRRKDDVFESMNFLSLISPDPPSVVRGICRVISDNKIVDVEKCVQTEERDALVYTWPSSSRTTLQHIRGNTYLNGVRAIFLQDGKSGNNAHLGHCHLNSRTRNIFCFYSLKTPT